MPAVPAMPARAAILLAGLALAACGQEPPPPPEAEPGEAEARALEQARDMLDTPQQVPEDFGPHPVEIEPDIDEETET